MKKILFLSIFLCNICFTYSQTYPEPEFTNELYYLKKDNGYTLVRLEKGASKMDTKTNVISGSEVAYSIDGGKSPVRLGSGNNVSFIVSSGSSGSSSNKSSSGSDSMMKANGMDPSMFNGFGGASDPSQKFTLYKMETEKGERKVLLQKAPGMNPFGKHKIQSSDKYTFSVKKIREGYWELVVDKPLPKGEYAFTMMGMGTGDAMTGATTLFAFGVD